MRLLGTERVGDRIEKWWLHTGDDGKDRITVETIQDVEPIINDVKLRSELPKHKDIRYVGTIPGTIIEELCRINAGVWGVKPHEAFREVMTNKTDRAQRIWNDLLMGSDYRKFQAKAV